MDSPRKNTRLIGAPCDWDSFKQHVTPENVNMQPTFPIDGQRVRCSKLLQSALRVSAWVRCVDLIELGADVDFVDDGRSILERVVVNRVPVPPFVLSRMASAANVDSLRNEWLLMKSIEIQHWYAVSLLVRRGVGRHYVHPQLGTPLHMLTMQPLNKRMYPDEKLIHAFLYTYNIDAIIPSPKVIGIETAMDIARSRGKKKMMRHMIQYVPKRDLQFLHRRYEVLSLQFLAAVAIREELPRPMTDEVYARLPLPKLLVEYVKLHCELDAFLEEGLLRPRR